MTTMTIAVWALAVLQVPLALVACHVLARGRASTATAAQWRRWAWRADRLDTAVLALFVLVTVACIWGFDAGGAAVGIDTGWRYFLPVWLALLVWATVLRWHGNRVEVDEARKSDRMPVLET